MTPHPHSVIPNKIPTYRLVLLRTGPSLGPRTNSSYPSASLPVSHPPPHNPPAARPPLRRRPPRAQMPSARHSGRPAARVPRVQGRLRGYRGKRWRWQRTRRQRCCRLRRTRRISWRARMMMRRARSPVSMELPPRPVAKEPPRLGLRLSGFVVPGTGRPPLPGDNK